MRKAFILDTNVLLFDPQALYKFGNNDVIIPIVVIEEIDRFKREMSEMGVMPVSFLASLTKCARMASFPKA